MVINFSFSNKERDCVLKYLEKNLGYRKMIPPLIKLLREKPDLITKYLSELDIFINLFNQYHTGGKVHPLKIKDLSHARHLSIILGDRELPNVDETIELIRTNSNRIKERIIPLLNQYKFLDTMAPTDKLAAALTVLSYRSVILSVHDDLREKNVMVGSAIEEFSCLMAIRGKKTKIFEAIKDWVTTDEDEEFSKGLVKKLKKL